MAEMIIQNPSITPNAFEYDQVGRVSAIAGHPLAGEGGGTIVKSDLMWKPTVGDDGYVSWTLASSATQPAPAYISGAQGPVGPQGVSGNPGKNPLFQINSENAHWEWKYSGDAEWTDLGVVASGAVGPQGLSGNSGKDGISPTVSTSVIPGGNRVTFTYGEGSSTYIDVMSGASGANGINGISPTVSTETIEGGNRVTFTYGEGSTESIDVMSGASGANGSDGFSPSVTTSEISPTELHPQGGTSVTITDKTGNHQFDIWNGINGQGATVNLFEGPGIQITENGTNYTITVSADYSGAATAWVNDQNYITNSDLTDYATKAYVEVASANAYDKAVEQIPDVSNFITKNVNDLTYYYKKTETSGATELSTEFAKYVIKPDTTQTVLNNNYLIYSTLTGEGTTTGWMPLSANYYSKTEADGRYLQKSLTNTLTGDGTDNKKLGVAWSALSGYTITSALSANSASYAVALGTTASYSGLNDIAGAINDAKFAGVSIAADSSITGNGLSTNKLGLVTSAENALTAVDNKLDKTAIVTATIDNTNYVTAVNINSTNIPIKDTNFWEVTAATGTTASNNTWQHYISTTNTFNYYKMVIHPYGTSSAQEWANDGIIHIILEA